ncbi:hypothetical protein pb186bvf_008893 [Paramecium bursaria]
MIFQHELQNTEKSFGECLQQQKDQMDALDQQNRRMVEKLQKELQKLEQSIQRVYTNQRSTTISHINYIQSIKEQKYKYEIKMENELELPCYRNRIFSIKLKLVRNNKLIINQNNILVELQIWTYDTVPKKLTHNNKGQSIYKGCQQAVIKKGKGQLGRIQVREVSSHFPRGMFMIVLVPVDDSGIAGDENKYEIKASWIKPLIIQEVSIKAKKFSDRHIPYFVKTDGTIQVRLDETK